MEQALTDLINWFKDIWKECFSAISKTGLWNNYLKNLVDKSIYYVTNIFRDNEPQTFLAWQDAGNGLDSSILATIITITFVIFVIWFVKKIFNLFTGYLR